VIIEQVSVDAHKVPSAEWVNQDKVLRLGPRTSSLEFKFTAIALTAPDKTRFRHKLEGADPQWVESDVARPAHYSSLPPGRYRFLVNARSADGIWNEQGASISLEILPPVWRAWWFILLCGVALVGSIWMVVRYVSLRHMRVQLHESEQRRAMERERTRIAQDMHDEIGSKLTRISFLSEVARQDAKEPSEGGTVEAIADTSRELLKALDEIVWAVNPRNDNLEHLAGYLEQYAREYYQVTPVECLITVPAVLPRVELTAEFRHNVFLAFEEALGNTLKHANPSRVNITMSVEGNTFGIRVQDDGRGFEVNAATGSMRHNGLINMRTRLRTVGGDCQTSSQPGKGTTVRLTCPLPKRTVGSISHASKP
jgi:signal transduction histidine kinase